MAQQQMTKEQLNEHIQGVLRTYLENEGGSTLRKTIESVVESQLERDDGDGGIGGQLIEHGKNQAEPGRKQGEPDSRGTAMGCYIRALAAARNDQTRAAQIAEKNYGRPDVAAAIREPQEKAMSSGDATAGGFLVPTEFSQEVIELLRASATVRSLGPTMIPMTSGTVKVPRITSGSAASYIGENVNIEKSELETGQLTLTFKKLAALVPVSNDLIRYAAPSADMIVRDDMIRALAQREDKAFIRDDGTAGTPKGIKEWIDGANKFDANTSVSLANVTVDLGKAMQNLMNANINIIIQQGGTGAIDVRCGWLFHPQQWRYLTTVQTGLGTYAFRDEMLRGTLWGCPYRVTTQVEDDTVYFGAFAHAVIGESLGLTVDASQEAAYHDGSSVVAAFSQDQTVIRVLAEHDFALRHDTAFSLIESVGWGD